MTPEPRAESHSHGKKEQAAEAVESVIRNRGECSAVEVTVGL
jgi:hypothetical protein